MEETIRVRIDLLLLAGDLSRHGRFVTVNGLSRRLGVSEKTAGKVLARMEKLGYARRFSYRTYELSMEEGLRDPRVLATKREIVAQRSVMRR